MNRQKDRDNRCPECCFVDLEEKTITKGKGIFKRVSKEKITLELTINFNEQWQELGMGRVKFGIRSGELKFKLSNGMEFYVGVPRWVRPPPVG